MSSSSDNDDNLCVVCDGPILLDVKRMLLAFIHHAPDITQTQRNVYTNAMKYCEHDPEFCEFFNDNPFSSVRTLFSILHVMYPRDLATDTALDWKNDIKAPFTVSDRYSGFTQTYTVDDDDNVNMMFALQTEKLPHTWLYIHADCYKTILEPFHITTAKQIKRIAQCRKHVSASTHPLLHQMSARFALVNGKLDYTLLFQPSLNTAEIKWADELGFASVFENTKDNITSRLIKEFGSAFASCFEGDMKLDLQARTDANTKAYEAFGLWWGSGLAWLATHYNTLCVPPVGERHGFGTHIIWLCDQRRRRLIFIDPDKIKSRLLSCMHDKTVRFIGLNLALSGLHSCGGDGNADEGHANTILIDVHHKPRPIAEHFEPNGPSAFVGDWFDADELHGALNTWFNRLGIDYMPPERTCRIGFQHIESQFGDDPEGFCQVWSLWYMNFRVANSTLDRDDAMQQALLKLQAQPLQVFIRNYAEWMHQEYLRLARTLPSGMVLRHVRPRVTIAKAINKDIHAANQKRYSTYVQSVHRNFRAFTGIFDTFTRATDTVGLDSQTLLHIIQSLLELFIRNTNLGHHIAIDLTLTVAKSGKTRSATPVQKGLRLYFNAPHIQVVTYVGQKTKWIIATTQEHIDEIMTFYRALFHEYQLVQVAFRAYSKDNVLYTQIRKRKYNRLVNYDNMKPYKRVSAFLILPFARRTRQLCREWLQTANHLLQIMHKTRTFRMPTTPMTDLKPDGRPTMNYYKWFVTSMITLTQRIRLVKQMCE